MSHSTLGSSQNSSKNQYIVLLLLCGIYLLSFFHRMYPTVLVLDISRDLGVSTTQVGLLSSGTMLAYGLMQLPSGLLSDAIGPRKALTILGMLAGVATLVFAFSPSFEIMFLSRILVGIGIAITVPALALLATVFPAAMYARASSILLASGGLGSILAAPPLVFLGQFVGWRMSVAVFGFITLAVTALIFIFMKETKPSTPQVSKPKATISSLMLGIKQVLTTKAFWPLALLQMCVAGSYFALASLWWGPYLMQACGLTKQEMAFIITAGSVAVMVVQPTIGYMSDVVFKSRKIPVIIFCALGTIGTGAMVFFTGEMSGWVLVVQSICFMLGCGAGAPLVFTMVKESFPLSLVGTATGCVNMFYPIWASILQSIYGVLLSYGTLSNAALGTQESLVQGYSLASWLIFGNLLFAFTLSFFMKETWKKH